MQSADRRVPESSERGKRFKSVARVERVGNKCGFALIFNTELCFGRIVLKKYCAFGEHCHCLRTSRSTWRNRCHTICYERLTAVIDRRYN